jgi:uncharacterized peroxidase-related enzyme
MAFIDTIPVSEASGEVLDMYQRQEGEWGFVPDYAKVFCHRPEVMARWGQMLAEIKRPVDPRRRELVTFAVAHVLRHSPCSLAHGKQLADMIGKDAVMAIAQNREEEVLSAADCAMLRYARRIAVDASAITAGEIRTLKEVHGFDDGDIFDIAAIAASRSFFTKVLDALGTNADMPFMKIDEDLRKCLTVGRPISTEIPESTGGAQAT